MKKKDLQFSVSEYRDWMDLDFGNNTHRQDLQVKEKSD
jgi:hypothetical protein